MEKIGTRFRQDVERVAALHASPLVKIGKHDRKQEVMAPCLARQAATVVPGVAAIGVAQEYRKAWTGTRSKNRATPITTCRTPSTGATGG